MKTNNKQQTIENKLDLSDRLCNTLNKIEKEVENNFSRYKRKDNSFRIDIEQEGKVRKIEQLKDYLNTILIDYDMSITFAGGSYWNGYTTILKLTIIE